MWRLLRGGAFRWLWAGQSLSMVGDRVQDIALAWLVLGLGASPLTLGTVLLAKAVTQAALLPLAGALTDRLAPKRTLLAADLIRAGLMAALVAAAAAGQLWPLYGIEIGVGAADAFFVPALTAIVPEAVEREDIAAANSLLITSEQVTMTAGPGLGGILVAALGPIAALALNGCSFLLGAAGVAPIAARKAMPFEECKPAGFLAELRSGLDAAREMPAFWGVLVLLVANSLVFNAGFSLGLPSLAHARFPQGAVALGVLLAAWGAGQLVGTVGAGVSGLPQRLGWLMVGHAGVTAFMFVVLALSGSLAGSCGVLFAGGVIGAYADDVAIPTWLQRNAKPGTLGRLASLVEIARVYPEPVSLAVFGALASASLPGAFLAMAAVMALATAVLASSPAIRRLSP